MKTNRTSATVGILPQSGAISLAGVEIDRGQRVGEPNNPTLWITSFGVKSPMGIWRALVLKFESSGLWPVVFDGPSPGELVDLETWVKPALPVVDRPVGDILSENWAEHWEGDFPGLAREQSRVRALLESVEVSLVGSKRIGLVAVVRPSDVPAAIGWFRDSDRGTGCTHSAVLRSWEVRFGAHLVSLGKSAGHTTLQLGVERSPRGKDQRLLLAGEMLAFAPALSETIAAPNDLHGPSGIAGAVERLAAKLEDSTVWSFVWPTAV